MALRVLLVAPGLVSEVAVLVLMGAYAGLTNVIALSPNPPAEV